jgi:hypothetical protein
MRRLALALAILVVLPACRSDFFDPTPGKKAPPPTVELIGRHIRMFAGEQSAVRVSFRPKNPSVRVRIDRSPSGGRVIACPLTTIDDPIAGAKGCLPDVPNGVRENLVAPALGAIALILEGGPIAIDLRLEYEEGGREFSIRIPNVTRPPNISSCKDYACNPIFEVSPVKGGAFTATVGWTAGGTGLVELVEGRVLARAFTSTGIPYRTAATVTGPSPLTVRSQLGAPSEYALTIQSAEDFLGGVTIDATWP